MTTVLTDSQNYSDIADAIREQLGVQATYLPSEMAAAILSISGGGFDPSNITWANSPWEDIATAMAAHYAGTVDMTQYWNVGDTRSVSLTAMSATGVGESHVAQTVEFVIMAKKHYDKSDGSGKAAFVIGQKNFLSNETSGEYGYMNSSNTSVGGWDSCARRTWCNNVYKSALPADLQSLLKQVNIITANGSGTTTVTSQDYIFLPAEKEIFGTNPCANSTAETGLSQYAWYATSANRIKKAGASGSAYAWWERSPRDNDANRFCAVNYDGAAVYGGAIGDDGIAPCCCF